jgi:hypothetical protein
VKANLKEVSEKPEPLAFSFAIRRKAWQKLSSRQKYVNGTDVFLQTGTCDG